MKQGRVETSYEEFKLSLEDILIFCTGCSAVPPMGFEINPEIKFQNSSPMPTANTCSLTLSLPLGSKDYDDFRYKMAFGISNAIEFGHV